MALELSPIIPLLAGLSSKQRENSLSVGALVKRQQHLGRWSGNVVVFPMTRDHNLELPEYRIDAKAAKSLGIANILSVHRPEVCTMLYDDQHGAVWCIRLSGPGLPAIQGDLFQSYPGIAVLVRCPPIVPPAMDMIWVSGAWGWQRRWLWGPGRSGGLSAAPLYARWAPGRWWHRDGRWFWGRGHWMRR